MVAEGAFLRRVLELAGEEAARLGHRYVGPEHLLLGLLRDGGAAARILHAQGVDLEAARAALGRLVEQGVLPGPRPSDAELLGSLGIDLEAVRRSTERALGAQALGRAVREATRARRRGLGRVPRTPLEEEPPVLATQALWLAHQRAKTFGHDRVSPELLLLGVLDDITTPWPRCYNNRWVRSLHVSVGLPEGYRGAAGPLLEALGADRDRLRQEVLASLGGDLQPGRPGR